MLQNLREEVLEIGHQMKAYGLIAQAGGTVCARDPESGLIAITASGMSYEDMTWQDVLIIDQEKNLLAGDRRISVATDMFLTIFKKRPDVNALIHTHSRYATAYATVKKPIPVITTTQGNIVGGEVPVVQTVHVGPYDQAFYDEIADTLGSGWACNLAAHGPICAGTDLDMALDVSVTIEVTAHTAWIAKFLGEPYQLTNEEIQGSFQYCQAAVGQK